MSPFLTHKGGDGSKSVLLSRKGGRGVKIWGGGGGEADGDGEAGLGRGRGPQEGRRRLN